MEELLSNDNLKDLILRPDFKGIIIQILKSFKKVDICIDKNRITFKSCNLISIGDYGCSRNYDEIVVSLEFGIDGIPYLAVSNTQITVLDKTDDKSICAYINSYTLYDDAKGKVNEITYVSKSEVNKYITLEEIADKKIKLKKEDLFISNLPDVDIDDDYKIINDSKVYTGIVMRKTRRYIKVGSKEDLIDTVEHYMLNPKYPREMIFYKPISKEETIKKSYNSSGNRKLTDYNSLYPTIYSVIEDCQKEYEDEAKKYIKE